MRTPRWFHAFIAAIEKGAALKVACQRGGVSTTYVHRLRRLAREQGAAAPPLALWFAQEWHAAELRWAETERRNGSRCLG